MDRAKDKVLHSQQDYNNNLQTSTHDSSQNRSESSGPNVRGYNVNGSVPTSYSGGPDSRVVSSADRSDPKKRHFSLN